VLEGLLINYVGVISSTICIEYYAGIVRRFTENSVNYYNTYVLEHNSEHNKPFCL